MQMTNTVAKMASYPPANFDKNLEHIVTVILKLTLTHPLTLALSQSFINTFDDFRTRLVPSETQCLLENISLGQTDALSAHILFRTVLMFKLVAAF
jgi:hypothetical protein